MDYKLTAVYLMHVVVLVGSGAREEVWQSEVGYL